jgi:membrane protease YdiL (CAAX protease family)
VLFLGYRAILPLAPARALPWLRDAYFMGAEIIVWLLPVLWLASAAASTSHADARGALAWLTLRPLRGGTALVAAAAWFAVQLCVSRLERGVWLPPVRLAYGPIGAISTLVLGPLFEEILFRGFALRSLREAGTRPFAAVALSSLAWVGLHAPGWLFHAFHDARPLAPAAHDAVAIALLGLVLGALQLRTRALLVPVAVHIVHNVWNEGVVRWLLATF